VTDRSLVWSQRGVTLRRMATTDVFILGAGFSRAVSRRMPLMSTLPSHLRALKRWRDEWDELLDRSNKNVEHLMTLLAQPQPWSTEANNLVRRSYFLNFTEQLAMVIRERQHLAIVDRKSAPPWLTRLVEHWVSEQATVITFNYDTIVEKVYTQRLPDDVETEDRTKRSSQDLYVTPLAALDSRPGYGLLAFGNDEPTFKLLKLHGSVNWLYSGAPNSAGEVLYMMEPSFGWQPEPDIYAAGKEAPDKVPLIVPPTTDKSTFMSHESVRTQWSRAALELQSALHVFFVGYSLPETDLMVRFMVQNSIVHPQSKVWVVNRAATPKGESLAPELAYAYESLGLSVELDVKTYVGTDEVLPRFVSDYIRGLG
jgi:hypothetical protein